MGRGRRIGRVAIVVGALAVVAASCTWATDTHAEAVGDTAAILAGDVHVTDGGVASHWFEYGLTTEYGARTPTQVGDPFWPYGETVQDEVRGLREGTTYHYRLCTRDDDGPGSCSDDRTFTTTAGQDSVIGDGVVTPPIDPEYIRFKVSVDAHPGAQVAGASGTAAEGESMFHAPDVGPVTCLRVEGNRATIGFLASSPYWPPGEEVPQPRLVFIEDNGPIGDRFGTRDVDDVTTCPAPTAADFPDFEAYGELFSPIVSKGNFVVHDHR